MLNLNLFNGQVKFVLTDKLMGDFRLQADGTYSRLKPVLKEIKAVDCIGFRAGRFTNKVVEDEKININFAYNHLGLVTGYADGFITERRHQAILMTAADCWSGVLFDKLNHRLCLVHLGLRNLYREDGSQSTLAVAVEKMAKRCPREDLLFWFGGGIQRCCYGFSETDLILLSKLQEKFPSGVITGALVRKGPRAKNEAVAVNLFDIIASEALNLGLRPTITPASHFCTSCSKTGNDYEFWSHVRGDKERNAAMVVML